MLVTAQSKSSVPNPAIKNLKMEIEMKKNRQCSPTQIRNINMQQVAADS